LEISDLKDRVSVPLQIYDAKGQLVYERVLEVTTAGSIHHEIVFGTQLRSGLYIVRAGETLQLTRKLFVE
jgi:hypothetical protein